MSVKVKKGAGQRARLAAGDSCERLIWNVVPRSIRWRNRGGFVTKILIRMIYKNGRKDF